MTIQHTSPISIDNLEQPVHINRLQRVRRSPKPGTGPHFLENLLQRLIHEHPSTLPVDEIEPAFRNLHAVCQELPLKFDGGVRYVDNLLINPEGRICIVECKLWHNPEAVRDVVAQILSYASALVTLQYEELAYAVRESLKQTDGDPIIARVLGPDTSEEDQESLIDGISRSLGRGDFLLLVVGDGIRSGVQQIAGLLQNASLGFSFGLVEMAVYAGSNGLGPFYLQPRILARTEIITRTVFITGDGASSKTAKVEPPGKAQTISEKEFYDTLGSVDPALPDELRSFLADCKLLGCEATLRRLISLNVEDPTGLRLNLGEIKKDGTAQVWGAAKHDLQYGLPVGRTYMERLVAFLQNAKIKDDSANPANTQVRSNDRVAIPLRELLSHKKEWLDAIQEVIERFRVIEIIQEDKVD